MRRSEFSRSLPISFVLFLAVTDLQTVAATTTKIAIGLGTDPLIVSYSLVLYSIAAVAAALMVRRTPATFASGGMLPWAALVYGLSSLLTGLASSVSLFLAARASCGFAAGFVSVLTITALAKQIPYGRRGASMTFVSLGYFVAPMIGVPASTFLVDIFEWRLPFLTIALLFSLAAFVTWRYGGRLYSVRKAGISPASANTSKATLRMAVLSAFFVSGSVVGLTTFVGTWFDGSYDASATQIGVVYSVLNFGSLLGGMSGGIISDRVGKRIVAMFASLLMAFFLLALLFFSAVYAVITVLFLVSLASSLRVAPLQALMTELPTPKGLAPFIATRNIASQLGIACSIIVCGHLFAEFGLAGVAATSASLSLAAWITIRGVVEPSSPGQDAGDERIPFDAVYD